MALELRRSLGAEVMDGPMRLREDDEFKEEAEGHAGLFDDVPMTCLHCYECGEQFGVGQVKKLRRHLRRKTAWTNAGLVGCRVNCLVNNKANNWQCGKVESYNPQTDLHDVEFYVGSHAGSPLAGSGSGLGPGSRDESGLRERPAHYNQIRTLCMRTTAFYVMERPGRKLRPEDDGLLMGGVGGPGDARTPTGYGTYYEDAPHTPSPRRGRYEARDSAREDVKEERFEFAELGGSASDEEDWDYVEDITEAHCYAQAMLYHIYGTKVQETGHRTEGHLCVTLDDKATAKRAGARLLYGEMLPRGVNRACARDRLHVDGLRTFYDLGMGLGKVCVQVFIQFPELELVYGVELSRARYDGAAMAARKLVQVWPSKFRIIRDDGDAITVQRLWPDDGIFRSMQLRFGSLLDCDHLANADVVLLETEIPHESLPTLGGVLASMRPQTQILSYLDLRHVWATMPGSTPPQPCPFRQMPYNISNADRFETSWSVRRGHHFYVFERTPDRFGSSAAYEHRAHLSVVDEEEMMHAHRRAVCEDPAPPAAAKATASEAPITERSPSRSSSGRASRKTRGGIFSLFSSAPGRAPSDADQETLPPRPSGSTRLSASARPSGSRRASASGTTKQPPPLLRNQSSFSSLSPSPRTSENISFSSCSTVTALSSARGPSRDPSTRISSTRVSSSSRVSSSRTLSGQSTRPSAAAPMTRDEMLRAELEESLDVDCNACFRLLGTRSQPTNVRFSNTDTGAGVRSSAVTTVPQLTGLDLGPPA